MEWALFTQEPKAFICKCTFFFFFNEVLQTNDFLIFVLLLESDFWKVKSD